MRVRRVGDRDGERFVSPSEQAERIRTACERDGLDLVDTIEELDVSGNAHPPIVDHDTWAAVQRMKSPRGRRAKSERLLSRLGVLRCGTCGSRMVVGTAKHSKYYVYRCPPTGDCTGRVTIAAEIAEQAVVDAVVELLGDVSGTASLDDSTADAERDLEHAEKELDAAVEAFTGLEDVQSARDRLTALRVQRDTARERLVELQAAQAPAIKVSAAEWAILTTGERRDLIRAVIDRAVVLPGRGSDRITVHPRGE